MHQRGSAEQFSIRTASCNAQTTSTCHLMLPQNPSHLVFVLPQKNTSFCGRVGRGRGEEEHLPCMAQTCLALREGHQLRKGGCRYWGVAESGTLLGCCGAQWEGFQQWYRVLGSPPA